MEYVTSHLIYFFQSTLARTTTITNINKKKQTKGRGGGVVKVNVTATDPHLPETLLGRINQFTSFHGLLPVCDSCHTE